MLKKGFENLPTFQKDFSDTESLECSNISEDFFHKSEIWISFEVPALFTIYLKSLYYLMLCIRIIL